MQRHTDQREVRQRKVLRLTAAHESRDPNTPHEDALPNNGRRSGGQAGTPKREMDTKTVYRGLVETLMREVKNQHRSNERAKERRERGKASVVIPDEVPDAQVEGPPAWDITPAIPVVPEPSNATGKQPDAPSQQRPQTSAEGGSGGGCSSKIPPAPSKQAPKAPPQDRTAPTAPPKDRTAQAPPQPQGSLGESENNATQPPKTKKRKRHIPTTEELQKACLNGKFSSALGW